MNAMLATTMLLAACALAPLAGADVQLTTGGNCNGQVDTYCNEQVCHDERGPDGQWKKVCTAEPCTLWATGGCQVG